MRVYFVVLLSAVLAEEFGGDQKTLKKLQVIFRHGYRYPFNPLWKDGDECASKYTTEIGNLTNLGKSQMSLLGSFIRVHYGSFIPNLDKVDLYSSNYTRDNDSARLVFQSLFTNFGYDEKKPIINLKLVEPSWDGPMNTNKTDPTYYNSWLENLAILNNYKDLTNLLKTVIKQTSEIQMDTLEAATDQMICEIAENCTLPNWLNTTVQERFLKFQEDIYSSYQQCQQQAIIKDNADAMILQINKVFDPKTSPGRMVTLYALHDTNIAVVLTRLGVFNNLPVPFGAAVFFELHDINKKSVVRVFYDNHTDYTNFRQLKLSCGWDCSYEDFVQLLEKTVKCSGCVAQASAVVAILLVSFTFVFKWL